MCELGDIKPVVQESIPKHHVFPLVEVLLERLVVLFPAVIFDQEGIEHSLGNFHVVIGLHHHA